MKTLALLVCAAGLTAQINVYSIEREVELGDRLATEFTATVNLMDDPRVAAISARLAANADPRFKYRVAVFDGGQPSDDLTPSAAFPADWRHLRIDEPIAVAGGRIFVPLQLVSRSDVQLAAIVAHAIGHVASRHATMLLTRHDLSGAVALSTTVAAREDKRQLELIPALRLQMLQESSEMRADLYAIQLLRDTGFDPSAMLGYLRTLRAEKQRGYPELGHRLDAAEKAIADLPQ
jgi:predicted Zn-dependent protease